MIRSKWTSATFPDIQFGCNRDVSNDRAELTDFSFSLVLLRSSSYEHLNSSALRTAVSKSLSDLIHTSAHNVNVTLFESNAHSRQQYRPDWGK